MSKTAFRILDFTVLFVAFLALSHFVAPWAGWAFGAGWLLGTISMGLEACLFEGKRGKDDG